MSVAPVSGPWKFVDFGPLLFVCVEVPFMDHDSSFEEMLLPAGTGSDNSLRFQCARLHCHRPLNRQRSTITLSLLDPDLPLLPRPSR